MSQQNISELGLCNIHMDTPTAQKIVRDKRAINQETDEAIHPQ